MEIKDLTMSYGTTKVLTGVNLKVEAGSVICILGISGSGKTTFLNILSGLLKPTSGSIKFGGKSIENIPEDDIRTKHIGMVFQQFELFDYMNALENVMAAMYFKSDDYETIRNRAVDLLYEMGMEKHQLKYPEELSGGQKQRVGIARALANDPDIIIADEPSGSLDRQNSEMVMEILLSSVTKDRSVIFSTHNLSIADHSDIVYILRDGKLDRIDKGILTETKKIKALYI